MTESKEKKGQSVVSISELLESGVHFGHQTRRWNPKMAPYIYMARNDIHVINLKKTQEKVNEAFNFVKRIASTHGTILFVGTKKQAQEVIRSEAERCKMPFVNQRWLGGTLTNFTTIKKSIQKLGLMESDMQRDTFQDLSKKEQSRWKKSITRLKQYLGGIVNLKGMPDAIFIVDTKKEQLAVKEAKKLNIPIVALVDTNSDPSEIDYVIPGNDDALRSVGLISKLIADAAIQGTESLSDVSDLVSVPAPKKEAVTAKS